MKLLARLNPRYKEYQETHADIERRLSDQELKAVRFEARLKRLELELGVVTRRPTEGETTA